MIKFVLFLLLAVGCSCFVFKTENGWYDTKDVQSVLQKLPTTFVVDCNSPEVICSVPPHIFSERTWNWLSQHRTTASIVDGKACSMGEMGPSLWAKLSCERLHTMDPWTPAAYDATRCTLSLYTTLGPGLSMTFVWMFALMVIYVSTLVGAWIIQQKKEEVEECMSYKFPRLRKSIPVQVAAFFLIHLTAVDILVTSYFPQDFCSFEGIPYDILLFVTLVCLDSLLVFGCCALFCMSFFMKKRHQI